MKIFKKLTKKEEKEQNHSRDAAKERLHLVLMQDRANVSADFLELMKQEIIEVIKKYIDVDERAIDVRLTNKENDDGTNGAPALYANIPIVNIKNEARKVEKKEDKKEEKKEEKKEKKKEDKKKTEKIKEQEEKEEIEDIEPPIEQIQNERIAKVILESGKFNQDNSDKKKNKKKEKKEEINQPVEENETEENKEKVEEIEQKEILDKEEKTEDTKEELKSED